MKTKTFLLTIITMGISIFAFAQQEGDRVVLKNQAVYEGYIANQIFGEKGVTYRINYSAFQKDFFLKNAHRQDVEYKGDQIPDKWREWARKNNYLQIKGKEEVLTLSRISFPGEPTRDYYVLVDGTRAVRVYSIGSDYIDVSADSVQRLERSIRPSTLLTDLNDVVTTLSNTYVGIIINQHPGKQLQIWDRKSGKISVVDYQDIIGLRKEPLNPDYTLFEQAPYLERVAVKGTNNIVQDGVIIEQNMVKDTERTMKLSTKSGVYTYKVKDVLSITKSPNPEYLPKYDIILEPGQTMVNRDSLLTFANILKLEKPGMLTTYYLDPQIIPENEPGGKLTGKHKKDVPTKPLNIVPVREKQVVIETNTPDINDIYVMKANEQLANLVPKKNPVKILCYTDSDLIRSTIKVEMETSINKTTRITFNLPEPGIYFVYLRGLDKSWVIEYKTDKP